MTNFSTILGTKLNENEVPLSTSNQQTLTKLQFPVPLNAQTVPSTVVNEQQLKPTSNEDIEMVETPTRSEENKDQADAKEQENNSSVAPLGLNDQMVQDTVEIPAVVNEEAINAPNVSIQIHHHEKANNNSSPAPVLSPSAAITADYTVSSPSAADQSIQFADENQSEVSSSTSSGKKEKPVEDNPEFFEVVIGDNSIVGKTLDDIDFKALYGGVVLAFRRKGVTIEKNKNSIPIRSGDTLLILARSSFYKKFVNSPDFFVISRCNVQPQQQERIITVFGKKFNMYVVFFCSTICMFLTILAFLLLLHNK